jgi:hypothetical protein
MRMRKTHNTGAVTLRYSIRSHKRYSRLLGIHWLCRRITHLNKREISHLKVHTLSQIISSAKISKAVLKGGTTLVLSSGNTRDKYQNGSSSNRIWMSIESLHALKWSINHSKKCKTELTQSLIMAVLTSGMNSDTFSTQATMIRLPT